ncbi:MAG: hypothetical protein A4E65_00744 [Syntrophorhabdus sp. PtaU1.Bin153]|nr:MAG: hypothetical protein A4E65_00744 [Syntrophorhabdus sp. PtaU1.Bin153]
MGEMRKHFLHRGNVNCCGVLTKGEHIFREDEMVEKQLLFWTLIPLQHIIEFVFQVLYDGFKTYNL